MAEAVSFRKGARSDYKDFKGVIGEITYDTTVKTAWVHDGNGNGYPLAREDCSNIDTSKLATGRSGEEKNLAYADLSNVELVSAGDVQHIQSALAPLGYALNADVNTKIATCLDKDFTNITNTGIENLNDITVQSFVSKNLSNLNTEILAGDVSGLPSGSKPVAYKDLSNINTNTLATGRSGTSGNKNLAYYDLGNLASQISSTALNIFFNNGVQSVSNLVDFNSATNSSQYPTALSVKNKFDSIPILPDTSSVFEANNVYLQYFYKYRYVVTINNPGENYEEGDIVEANEISCEVVEVNSLGEILEVEALTFAGKTDKTAQNVSVIGGTGTGATVDIVANQTGSGSMSWGVPTISIEDILFDNQQTSTTKYINERPGIGTIDNVQNALRALGLNQQDIIAALATKISQNDLPATIQNIVVTDSTGVITVTLNKTPSRTPSVKALIGGTNVVGSWTSLNSTMTFTPNDPDDILSNSWIVVL